MSRPLARLVEGARSSRSPWIKRSPSRCLGMALGEVVEDPDLLPSLFQRADRVTSNVPGAANDKNRHEFILGPECGNRTNPAEGFRGGRVTFGKISRVAADLRPPRHGDR